MPLGWEKLLPQLVSLIETNRRERSEREREERKRERRKCVYTLLKELKPLMNPFRRLLEDLGFDLSQSLDTLENGMAAPKALVDYPFPNYATVLEAPYLDDVNNLELSAEEVKELFYSCQEAIEENINEWREKGEQQLVDWWKMGGVITVTVSFVV